MEATIVFSDLDGTLLDHQSYSWQQAEPGLALLRRHGIPLIPSTSKTVAELVDLAARIGFGPIGIIENGAAIVWQLSDTPELENLGTSYAELRTALNEIRDELGLPLIGFGDLDADGIAGIAGIDLDTAARSRQRCGDEPFWCKRELSPEEAERLQAAVTTRGLRLSRGGRYFHLTGESDKGTAARRVIEHLGTGRLRTAAFGDAANDRPLLEAVGHPYAVRRPGGEADAVLSRVQGVRITEGVGPAGFSQGVDELIRIWTRPNRPAAG